MQKFNEAAARRVALGGALIVAAFAIYEISLAVRLWRVMPFSDQWEAVPFYQSWIARQHSLLDLLLAQHNEHRLPLTRLGFLVDFSFFQGRSTFVFPLLLLAHVALGAALGWVATRGRQAGERALGIATGVAFLVSPLQIENLTLPFHLGWAACGLFSLGALYWTARLAEPTAMHAVLGPLAAISTWASVYSSANGIATALVILVMVLALPMPRLPRILVAAGAISSIAAFFLGYVLPPHHQSFLGSFSSRDEIRHVIYYGAAFLGSTAQYYGLAVSVKIGALGLLAWVLLTLVLVFRWLGTKELDAANIAMLMLAAVSIATAIMTAIGRAGLGTEQALSSRYGTWALLFWLPLLVLARRMSVYKPWSKLATGGAAMAMLSLCFVSGRELIPRHRLRVAMMDAMTEELRSGNVPQHLDAIYPNVAAVLSRIEFLRQHGLSIFANDAPPPLRRSAGQAP